MAGAEPVAAVVEDKTGQQVGGGGSWTTRPLASIRIQLGLDPLPEVAGQDGGVLAVVGDTFVFDLAEIDPVAQQVIDRTATEGLPAAHLAMASLPALAHDVALFEVRHESAHRHQQI